MYHLNLYFKNVAEPLSVTLDAEADFNGVRRSISAAMSNKEVLIVTNMNGNVTHVIDGAELRAMI